MALTSLEPVDLYLFVWMDHLDNVSRTDIDGKFQRTGFSGLTDCLVYKQLLGVAALLAIMQGFSTLSLGILGQLFLCLERLSRELSDA